MLTAVIVFLVLTFALFFCVLHRMVRYAELGERALQRRNHGRRENDPVATGGRWVWMGSYLRWVQDVAYSIRRAS